MGYGYYGHGSWVILLVLLGFAMRALAMRRRRSGARGGASARSFTHGTPAAPTGAAPSGQASGPGTTFTGIAPGWLKDPSGRHEQRYWSGTEWTEHVSDGGVPGVDPPPGP